MAPAVFLRFSGARVVSQLEQYGTAVVTGPTWQPVTLAQVKTHCRVDAELRDDDAELEDTVIPAARDFVEGYTGRILAQQTLRMSFDRFPCGEIRLPCGPVRSVSSVEYLDITGTLQAISSSLYDVDTDSLPARIRPKPGQFWPVSQCALRAVRVTYVAGETTTATVPAGYRKAVLMLCRAWYDGAAEVGELPDGMIRFLDSLIVGLPHGAA